VARVAGPGLGLATLAADMLKGMAPVWLALAWGPADMRSGPFPIALALLAFFGHLFPLYTGFRGGGKGVATAAGGFALIASVAVMAAGAAFVIFVFLFRRVSIGSLAAACCCPSPCMRPTAHGRRAPAPPWSRPSSSSALRQHPAVDRRTEPVFRLRRKEG